MSSTPAGPTIPRDESTPALAATYARNATGLVREIPMKDMITFNAASTGTVGAALAVGVFYAYGVFPGANVLLDFVLAVALGGFVWVTFALLSSAMPRTGGDYLYGSRVLHPAIGLGSNLATWLGTILSCGAWAYWLTQVGLAPMFGTIGTLTRSQGWLNAAKTLSGKTDTFLIAIALLVLLSVLAALGTKIAVRAMFWCYALAFVGFVVTIAVLLVTSHHHFVTSFNSYARPYTHQSNTYAGVIQAGGKAGIAYPSSHGYSFKNTLGALGIAFSSTLWVWWGIYMAGEMKGAGRRKRQLTTILTAGYGQGILLVLAAAIILSTVGTDFLASASSGNFLVSGVQPYFTVFAAITVASHFIGILLSLLFLLWFFPACFINLAMCQRVPFAWAFDGLTPGALAKVDDRTHTPIIAIALTCVLAIGAAAWATYSAHFFAVLAVLASLSVVPIVTTGVCAFVLPRRRPEIYQGSPAEWKVRGIAVLPTAGFCCAAIGVFDIALFVIFHKNFAVSQWWLLLVPIVGAFAVGATYFYAARAFLASRGVNIDLVYKSIPPE